MADDVEFDPLGLMRELNDADVQYVVIGAAAGRILGSPLVTADLDICYARNQGNQAALASMLRRVHARIRGAGDEIPVQLDAKSIGMGDSFTFETDLGDFDIVGTPPGTSGYDDLLRNAMLVDLDWLEVRVASIDDLIRMKRASGRLKDLVEVEILGALREELDAIERR